eukprot:m.327308 g.327308  ORF g.327308 m.327308 type:complete len:126 (+) comp27678_c0_seq2:1096-1473(+)
MKCPSIFGQPSVHRLTPALPTAFRSLDVVQNTDAEHNTALVGPVVTRTMRGKVCSGMIFEDGARLARVAWFWHNLDRSLDCARHGHAGPTTQAEAQKRQPEKPAYTCHGHPLTTPQHVLLTALDF